jgi:hypothetical protein
MPLYIFPIAIICIKPPTMAPILHPVIAYIFIPSFSRDFRTPICASPLAPPPPRANPNFVIIIFIVLIKLKVMNFIY